MRASDSRVSKSVRPLSPNSPPTRSKVNGLVVLELSKVLREARDSDVMSHDIVDRWAKAWWSAWAYFGEVLVNEVLAPSDCGF